MIGVLRCYRSLWSVMAKVAADVLEDPWQIRAALGATVGRHLRRQQFDRHRAVVGRRVAGARYLAHAAAAQQLDKATTFGWRALHGSL